MLTSVSTAHEVQREDHVKVRIEFEIPNWTRWIAVGLVAGLALGYGIANVRADTVAVTTTWNKGDVLTAEALNQNFQDLRNAIESQQAALNAMQLPDCPMGYLRDSTAPASMVVCKKGSDEVVRVATGGEAFWIDRYEASIWSDASGTETQFGATVSDYPTSFPSNGQYTTSLYAVSKAGVRPSAFCSWYQADAACEASGKVLPTGEQWIRAARNTIDSGINDGTQGFCATSADASRATGLGKDNCVSQWGAEDMIGNLWEWTADWFATLPTGTDVPPGYWSVLGDPSFNGDLTQNIASQTLVSDVLLVTSPAAACRGGSKLEGDGAGVFALSLYVAPPYRGAIVGFRCVLTR
jgi:formylglycine-generating enzyme required for sulfatase activity